MEVRDPGDVIRFLDQRGLCHTSWAGWQRVDEHETALGKPYGRRRIKVVPRDELVDICRTWALVGTSQTGRVKLTILAATGGVGRHLLRQAVATGHDVTVVVRNPARLPATAARAVVTDLAAADPALLRGALDGADAVLSGLGARSGAEAGVASRGTRAVVEAMREAGVRRIVVVSAASVGTVPSPDRPDPPRHNPGDGFLMRHIAAPLAKAAFRRHYVDLALMEDVLRDSDLDWTVSRPPRLLDVRLCRGYRTAVGRNVRGGAFIARADVAHHMLAVLDRRETFHRDIGIAY